MLDEPTEDDVLIAEGVKALRYLNTLPDMAEVFKKNNEAMTILIEEVVKIREILSDAANGL